MLGLLSQGSAETDVSVVGTWSHLMRRNQFVEDMQTIIVVIKASET